MGKLTIAGTVLGLGGLILLCSSPAHAQWGGSIGGGASLAKARVQALPSYPAHPYDVVNVSGDGQSYTPSTFLPFDEAVGEGTASYAPPKTVVEAAADTRAKENARDKSKIVVEQDARGNMVVSKKN